MLILLCAPLSGAEIRTWISTDGRELEAELIRVEGDNIVVRRLADWRVFTIPINTLSDADREYLDKPEDQTASAEDTPTASSSGFPEKGLKWPSKVKSPGNFEVEILEENNETSVYRYRAGHFHFSSDVKLARKVVASFAEIFESTYLAVKSMPLDWDIEPPEDGYAVRLFNDRGNYVAAGGIPGSAGVYVASKGTILVPTESLGVKKSSTGVTLDKDGSHGTLIHEITHQIHHDWLARLPAWMVEGFAEYIEAVPYERGAFAFNDLEPVTAILGTYRLSDEVVLTPLEQLMSLSIRDWNTQFLGDPIVLSRQYQSAFLLVYYFAHLDGKGDGRRLWEAVRVLEKPGSGETWEAAQERAREILLDGRSYEELFEEMEHAYRSEKIKLLRGK